MRAHGGKTTLATAVIGPVVSQDISVAENTKPGSADALPGIFVSAILLQHKPQTVLLRGIIATVLTGSSIPFE